MLSAQISFSTRSMHAKKKSLSKHDHIYLDDARSTIPNDGKKSGS